MHKILIRPLIVEDAHTSYRWRNDAEIWKFTGSRPDRLITPEIEIDWLKRVLVDSTSKRFAIIVDEVYVGNIQLTDIGANQGTYHIFIGEKAFWGKGIARLATYQILYYAKEILGLDRVILEVDEENDYAIRSYKSSGFVEGERRNGHLEMSIKLVNLHKPTVSVFVMVYNHEKYLDECLLGILNQHCNFNFDIVLGEDCSPDKSREIVLKYANQYPGKFRLLLHEKNIGAVNNQNTLLLNCSGQYIAMCEGDDYWTDPFKLQKQVDFLEQNTDCNLVSHRVMVYDEDSGEMGEEELNKSNVPIKRTLADLALKGNFMHTPSVVFRNNIDYSSPLFKGVVGDYILWFLNGEKGLYGYIPDFMAVYRKWGGSVWSKKKIFFITYEWLKLLRGLQHRTKSRTLKKNLRIQARNVSAFLGISSLTSKEKIQFFWIMLQINPLYGFDLTSRLFSKLLKKTK